MSNTTLTFGPYNAVAPRMTLAANGNLGIGTTSQNASITIGTDELTAAALKELKQMAGFIEYLKKSDPKFEALWTAYAVAEKLEK